MNLKNITLAIIFASGATVFFSRAAEEYFKIEKDNMDYFFSNKTDVASAKKLVNKFSRTELNLISGFLKSYKKNPSVMQTVLQQHGLHTKKHANLNDFIQDWTSQEVWQLRPVIVKFAIADSTFFD